MAQVSMGEGEILSIHTCGDRLPRLLHPLSVWEASLCDSKGGSVRVNYHTLAMPGVVRCVSPASSYGSPWAASALRNLPTLSLISSMRWVSRPQLRRQQADWSPPYRLAD